MIAISRRKQLSSTSQKKNAFYRKKEKILSSTLSSHNRSMPGGAFCGFQLTIIKAMLTDTRTATKAEILGIMCII